MDDTVYRQQAIDAVSEGCQEWRGIFERCKEKLLELPSAQPKIVRCCECKYMMADGRCYEFADDNIRPSASDFCSAGVRK